MSWWPVNDFPRVTRHGDELECLQKSRLGLLENNSKRSAVELNYSDVIEAIAGRRRQRTTLMLMVTMTINSIPICIDRECESLGKSCFKSQLDIWNYVNIRVWVENNGQVFAALALVLQWCPLGWLQIQFIRMSILQLLSRTHATNFRGPLLFNRDSIQLLSTLWLRWWWWLMKTENNKVRQKRVASWSETNQWTTLQFKYN